MKVVYFTEKERHHQKRVSIVSNYLCHEICVSIDKNCLSFLNNSSPLDINHCLKVEVLAERYESYAIKYTSLSTAPFYIRHYRQKKISLVILREAERRSRRI